MVESGNGGLYYVFMDNTWLDCIYEGLQLEGLQIFSRMNPSEISITRSEKVLKITNL